MAKTYTMDLCEGPLLRKLLRFSLPLMLSGMLQLLFNAADVVVVGRFAGSNSLAAVGATTHLVYLVTYLFVGLATGANVVTARYWGAGQKDEVQDCVHTAMGLSIFSGLFLMVFGVAMAHTMLDWLHTPGEILTLASLYLRIYFLGMPATMLYNFGSALLRAAGDTRRPMVFLLLAGGVNFGLNLYFVIHCHWGVAGVGWATVISQYLAAILVIRCLMQQQDSLHLTLGRIRIRSDKLVKILQIGIPAGIEGMVFGIANVIVQGCINSFGQTVIAANAAAASVESFVYGSINTFYQAVMTFVSQNLGAGKQKRMDRSIVLCTILCVVTATVLGGVAVVFGPFFLGLYATEKAVIAAGMLRLRWICLTYFLCGFMDVLAGGISGMGYAVRSTINSLVGACGVRLLWIFLIFPKIHAPWVLYASYPVSWITTIAADTICLMWVRKQVQKKLAQKAEIQPL